MNKATINGAELAYEVRGTGEPVIMLHCGFIADGFTPLFKESSLSNHYKLVNYHRRGYGQSGPAPSSFGIEEQVQDLLALLQHLGIDKAHVVAHSFGANIAIQLAVSAPDMVHSLTLIEPPLPFFMSPEVLQVLLGSIGQAMGLFGAGDKVGAMNLWLTGAFGPGWQDVINAKLPGGYNQAAKDADTAMLVEGSALQTWRVGPEQIKRISQPVLSVLHVDPYWQGFQEVHEGLSAVLPQIETLVVPNVTHLMQIQNSRSVADGLVSFLARHPLRVLA